MTDSQNDDDKVVIMAERAEFPTSYMWTAEQMLQFVEKFLRSDDGARYRKVLVLALNEDFTKVYDPKFFASHLNAIEVATLCRVSELKALNSLSTVHNDIAQRIFDVAEDVGGEDERG